MIYSLIFLSSFVPTSFPIAAGRAKCVDCKVEKFQLRPPRTEWQTTPMGPPRRTSRGCCVALWVACVSAPCCSGFQGDIAHAGRRSWVGQPPPRAHHPHMHRSSSSRIVAASSRSPSPGEDGGRSDQYEPEPDDMEEDLVEDRELGAAAWRARQPGALRQIGCLPFPVVDAMVVGESKKVRLAAHAAPAPHAAPRRTPPTTRRDVHVHPLLPPTHPLYRSCTCTRRIY